MQPDDPQHTEPPSPRTRHHYELAHMALRQVAFQSPYEFFGIMVSPQRQAFLEDLWQQIRANCDADGEPDFGPGDLQIHPQRLGDYMTLLIQMPPAHHVPEAHLICVVLAVPLEEIPQQPSDPRVHYFTLEKGAQSPMLCAWDGEDHLNYGDFPGMDTQAFLDEVVDRL